MRKIITLFFLLFITFTFSQKHNPFKLDNVTKEEVKMKFYEKDSSAVAVVLLEKGQTSVQNSKKYPFVKHYYVKLKVLKKSGYDNATVEFPLGSKSEVFNIRGITYNLSDKGEMLKSFLNEENIFKTNFHKKTTINKFTMPNVKVGSVIEYKYSIKSKNYGLYDWYFQSEIPKVKSSYVARVPPIFYFNVAYVGIQEPTINKISIKKKCIGVDPCQVFTYQLEDIPAFVEEKYINSKENYIYKLIFEKKYFNPYGNFSSSYGWNLLDEYFKKLYDSRLKKIGFFKRKLPDSIKKEKNTLLKVKKTYQFIRNHYSLDNSYNKSISKSFKDKKADYININLSLYNALKALNLKPKIGLLSTRSNGKATKVFPSLESLNYSLTYIKINNKDYFLDATNKKNVFGLVPFKCLNDDVRILDFDKGSYWTIIKSVKKSSEKINTFLEFNSTGEIKGKIVSRKAGQFAFNHREIIENVKEEDYITLFEKDNVNLEIDNYNVKNLEKVSKNVTENFEINLELDEDNLSFNPFIIDRLKENPFKLKERKYHVDFGFPFKKYHTVIIKFPANYTIENIPKNLTVKLPNNGGNFIFKTSLKEGKLSIFLLVNQLKKAYSNEEYKYLKEFYNHLISIQNLNIKLKEKK